MEQRDHEKVTVLSDGRGASRKAGVAGFTLIELLIVVGIIAILAGITLGITNYANRKAAVSRALADMETIKAALEEYRLQRGEYFVVTNVIQLTNLPGFSNEVGRFSPTGIRLSDPWGRGYYYTTHNRTPALSYRLYSDGPSTNTTADDIDSSAGST